MRTYRKQEWEEWFAEADDYRQQYGDLLVPYDFKTPDGYRLGRWIERQRAMYNGIITSTLDEYRIHELESIGMVWKLEYRRDWDRWMEQIRNYSEEHGNLLVPRNYENGSYRLGNWISEQRRNYWDGHLSEDQIKDLESCGMVWSEGERRPWNDWYEDAVCYRESFGDLRVPTEYRNEDGYKLGTWITGQRSRRNDVRSRAPLTDAQIRKLDELGMVWSYRNIKEEKWNSMYVQVKKYLKKEGKLPIWPTTLKTADGRNMPHWITVQRSRLSGNKCSAGQIRKLHQIGIYAWKTDPEANEKRNERKWDTMYGYVTEYFEKNGKLPLEHRSIKAPDGRNMSVWICNQKIRLRKDECSDEQVEKLRRLGIVKRETEQISKAV